MSGGSKGRRGENPGPPKPKNLKEVPAYLKLQIGGFFSRLFYIIRLVWETSPGILILQSLLCLLGGILPVVGATLSARLLDAISTALGYDPGSVSSLFDAVFFPVIAVLLAYFVYEFLQRVMGRISSIVNAIAGELVVDHIKRKIIGKAKEVDLQSFDKPEFYEKLENANREAGMRPLSILNATFQLLSTIISIASFVVILTGLHPLAPLFILVMAVPGALVNYAFRNRNYWYIRFHSKDRRQMNYYSGLMVNKDMSKEIRLMGTADTFIEKYKQAFARYFRGLKKLIFKEGAWQVGMALLSLLTHLVLFSYAAFRVVQTGSPIGNYSLYTGALNSIASGVSTLVAATSTIYEGTLFIDNMMTFMREPVTVTASGEGKRPARHCPHTIEFCDVSFRYPGGERDILSHLNLRFEAGESVVLVGLNGAGKTTLIKLLTRLYDPTEGCILLDGTDLREYDPVALYELFGIVFQDFGRYAVSVRENITLGDVRRKPTEEAVRAAAVAGNAEGFIQELPRGYDTPLQRVFEEDGVELSGGQWQKLSIARAFYKDSDILILDEPTASLDAIAEQEVFREFAELCKDKVSVFVSHRLSSAVTADKIVVLDGGRVAEVGTHRQLMQLGGVYYRLFSTQARLYREAPEA